MKQSTTPEPVVMSVGQQGAIMDLRKFVDLVLRKGYDLGQVALCMDYLERNNVEHAMAQNKAITTDLLTLVED